MPTQEEKRTRLKKELEEMMATFDSKFADFMAIRSSERGQTEAAPLLHRQAPDAVSSVELESVRLSLEAEVAALEKRVAKQLHDQEKRLSGALASKVAELEAVISKEGVKTSDLSELRAYINDTHAKIRECIDASTSRLDGVADLSSSIASEVGAIKKRLDACESQSEKQCDGRDKLEKVASSVDAVFSRVDDLEETVLKGLGEVWSKFGSVTADYMEGRINDSVRSAADGSVAHHSENVEQAPGEDDERHDQVQVKEEKREEQPQRGDDDDVEKKPAKKAKKASAQKKPKKEARVEEEEPPASPPRRRRRRNEDA